MDSHGQHSLDPREKRELSPPVPGLLLVFVGAAAVIGAYFLARASDEGSPRFWFAYLLSYAFFLSISLGALFYVMIQHLTRAGTSVVVRRLAEILAGNLTLLAVLLVPILAVTIAGQGELYHWATWDQAGTHDETVAGGTTTQVVAHGVPEASPAGQGRDDTGHGDMHDAHDTHNVGTDPTLIHKRPYLNIPFFVIRWVIYLAAWCGLASYFWRSSLRQDFEGDPLLTVHMQRASGVGLLVFGLTVTFASFDLLMSLDAHWYSTIFGVYFFSGGVVAFFAALIVILVLLQRAGFLTSSVTIEHYHDLGKYLFAFVFFWGYIAFSQYMLIWYGNIPEETGWLMRRGMAMQSPNVFSIVIVVLLIGHFLVPFAGLLSRQVKRRRELLCLWAVWLLAMHWLDLYWLIVPELTTHHLPMLVELLCLVGLGLMFTGGLIRRAAGRPLIPLADPRLGESLAFHNV